MNSVELVKQICIERKIPISKLERDCGFSNGYIRKLKEGKFPSDRLLLISQYLDLPISYLIGEEGNSPNDLTANDKRDIAQDLASIMDKLNSKEAGPASFDGNDIPEDDRELFAAQLEAMLVRLKKINKELYNPNKNKK